MKFTKFATSDPSITTISTTSIVGYYYGGKSGDINVSLGVCLPSGRTEFVTTTLGGQTFADCCYSSSCTTQFYSASSHYAWYSYGTGSAWVSCSWDYITFKIYHDFDITTTDAITQFNCIEPGEFDGITLWRDFSKLYLPITTSSTVNSLTSKSTTTPYPTHSPPASDPSSAPNPTESSRIWIVGAVLGPVAACVLVGALAFFLAKRKSRSKSSPGAAKGGYSNGNDQMMAYGGHDYDQPVRVG
ncbi:hypothetical protein PG985_016060 [Apiospora marii]|uniref:uncharacterized protein n=1 Tax=Apiospora marii TaxID=335849 RepID=UPI0031316435